MIAYCFLMKEDTAMRKVWSLYFGGDFSNVYVHSKNPKAVYGPLANRLIPQQLETEWGHVSLVRAQNALFAEAFKNPETSQVVLLSDSCAPLTNIREVENALMDRGTTLGAVHPQESLYRKKDLKNQSSYPVWVKHSQFVSITREVWDACFARHDTTEDFADMFASDEHYYGTVIAAKGLMGACSRKAFTYVKWPTPGGGDNHPVTLNIVPETLYDTDYLFARKFTKETVINSRYLERIAR